MRKTLRPLVCLAGCLVGAVAAAQDAAIPSRLSLADALRLAEQRNPALAVARLQAAVTDTDAVAARRRPNPVASVSSEGYNGDPAGAGFFNQQELVFQVEQELETGGRRRLRGEVAAAAGLAGRSAADDLARQVRLDVKRAYFQLVLARLDMEASRAALGEIDRIIELNRARYRQGEISGAELRRLEVERLRFTDDVLGAELGARNAGSALLALLGAPRLDVPVEPVDPLTPPAGTSPALAPPPAGGTTESLIAAALAGRPDIAAARQDHARALAEVELQKALRTPNVSVGAGMKRDFGVNGLVWGVSVPLPVFDRNAGGIARAEAERRLAESRLRERELAASLDVQQAANLVDISGQRVKYLESDYLQKAREARDAILSAYQSGESSLVDFLDAQRAYRDVQRAYNRALFEHRLSLFQLDAAVGSRH
jgi:outer membrane protein, heavy metal efflux system